MRSSILLFIPLLSCGSIPVDYSYGISPGFTPHQQEIIIESLHDWENVVNDKSILNITNIHVGDCDPTDAGDTCIILQSEATPYVANVCSHQHELGCCATDVGAGSEDPFPLILINTESISAIGNGIFNSNDVLFKQVVLHEIGHSLSLVHQEQKVLMNPIANHASATITCGDLQQFYSLRGIRETCPQGLN